MKHPARSIDLRELELMESVVAKARKLVDKPASDELRRRLEWLILELDTHRGTGKQTPLPAAPRNVAGGLL